MGNGCVLSFKNGVNSAQPDIKGNDVDTTKGVAINDLKVMSGTSCFITGDEDGLATIFDIRAQQSIASYTGAVKPKPEGLEDGNVNHADPIMSVATSKSHRAIYVGRKSGEVECIDALTGKSVWTDSRFGDEFEVYFTLS